MSTAKHLAAASPFDTFLPEIAPDSSHVPEPLAATATLCDFHQTPLVHDARSRSLPAESVRAAKAPTSQCYTPPIPRCALLEIAGRATLHSLHNAPWRLPTAHHLRSCRCTPATHPAR